MVRCSHFGRYTDIVDFSQPAMALSSAALAFALIDDSSSDSSTSSDSSSSDEERKKLYELFFRTAFLQPTRKRPRIEGYIDGVVRMLSDEQFRRKFRVSRSLVADLCNGFETSPMYPRGDNGGLPAKTPEEHVLAFLWYAANKACIRDVAIRFGMAEATTFRVVERIMSYLVKMAKTVITFPDDLEQLSTELEQVSGVPGAVGCIGECYVSTHCPPHKVPLTNKNRHNFPSVTVQAVCDHKKKFLDVAVGNPTTIHDSRIFHKTGLARKLPRICTQGDFHVLGDSTYPLQRFLLTPFRNTIMLTPSQIAFNTKVCAARVGTKDAFVDLKARFRQLRHVDFFIVDKVKKFILACCVLHNLCIDSGDTTAPPIPNDEADNSEWHNLPADRSECFGPLTAWETALCCQGEQKRERVMQAMNL